MSVFCQLPAAVRGINAKLSFIILRTWNHNPSAETPIFLPEDKWDLSHAITACLDLSSDGNCASGDHGPIKKWDTSLIVDMHGIFKETPFFNADISKWNVSSVANMQGMFKDASFFNADISEWNVAHVTDMRSMFRRAESFNVDISEWNVARVTDMGFMFGDAKAFRRILCGVHWVESETVKQYGHNMFQRSPGSVSTSVCATTPTTSTTSTSTSTTSPMPAPSLPRG